MSVIMRHPHQTCRESPTTLQSHAAKMLPCSCCPYGYHIDLDFVRYCETLANADPSDGELKRRDRRRQRKSMEVMLGFEQIMQLQQITPFIEEQELLTMKREKELLEQKVKEEQTRRANATVLPAKTTTTPLTKPFHSQRHSPISLDSLNARLQSPFTRSKSSPNPQCTESSTAIAPSSITPPANIVQKRDASQMTTVLLTREIGITTNHTKTRTTAVNTDQNSYTKQELQAAIDLTIERQQREQFHAQQKKLTSVGTQMQPMIIPQKQTVNIGQQTHNTESQTISTQTLTNQKSVEISCHPQTRSIGTSDHSTVEHPCRNCSIEKRSIGCGPDEEPSLISLKLMDAVPAFKRSSTFSLGDGEKFNISRKTIGTQYTCAGPTRIDSSTQHIAPLMRDKQCQQSGAMTCNQMNDTSGLIKIKSQGCTTDTIQEIKKSNAESNTERQQLESVSTNTDLPLKQLDHGTNTMKIHLKDAACGRVVKPHISISCADNYCDTCKDSIVSLDKGFAKNTNGVPSVSASETSRIPRPMTLMSPRTERKFLRQNTYTVPSSDESPIEQQICPAEMFLRLSALDTSSTKKSKPQKQHDASADKNVDVHLPATSTELLPETNPSPQRQNETGLDERKTMDRESLVNASEKPMSTVAESLELGCNDDGLIVIQTTDDAKQTVEEDVPHAFKEEKARAKAVPNKEMLAALKVINDSLHKTNSQETNLKNANRIVQWFRFSSTDTANPLDVEDYLDCFEEFSNQLLKYMVNLCDTNGNTAMHYAVSHANFDIVSILLDSKVCNVNQTNNAGYTCVMLVSLAKLKMSAHHAVVRRLFQMSDVNIRAKKHCQTALMLAVSHGNIDMVQMLLDAGADINIQDEDGSTALMCAAEHGRIDIVKLLLAQSECDSCIQDVDGSTALKISLEAGYRDIGVLLYAHEHITRGKTSPYTSLRRKKKQSALSRPTSVSTPASPAPSTKFQHHHK